MCGDLSPPLKYWLLNLTPEVALFGAAEMASAS